MIEKLCKKKSKIYSRDFILRRDNYKCRICGSEDYQLDIHHIMPSEIGGHNEIENKITLCKSCHMFMHCNPVLIMKSKQGMSTAIKQGLARRKFKGLPIGRINGSKDKKKRRIDGYYKLAPPPISP